MSELEQDASLLLKPMINGENVVLSESQQALIAFWGLKTALMLNLTASAHLRTVPSAHYQYLYQEQKPVDHSFIWLGAYFAERPYNTFYSLTKLLLNDPGDVPPPHGYLFTLAIRHLVFEIHGFVSAFELGAGPDWNIMQPLLGRIWPITPGLVGWPPPAKFTSKARFDEFAGKGNLL